MDEPRCGNCATYNKIKWPGDPICEKCSDLIPSWNQGCDNYTPLPEPPKEATHD